jgi:hypothetical protein
VIQNAIIQEPISNNPQAKIEDILFNPQNLENPDSKPDDIR